MKIAVFPGDGIGPRLGAHSRCLITSLMMRVST
ncbi:MAG: hypothetical protein CM15mP125_0710 [Gammaproteobacteria bacterium]|nr:MAG: hypothetical protein CM15mP125_0710 [Gammaproteobacteria bacterium]